ncbi:hypothetical protein ACM66B_006537 [Microbotryomycetes sp. NB124-2]
MATQQSKIDLASKLILQSPPGEENDVFNDLRVLVNDDDALERGILPALAQYNKDQYIVVNVSADSKDRKVIITDASELKTEPDNDQKAGARRHVDPATQTSFLFDDMKLTILDEQPLAVDDETERIRSSIAQVLSAYVSNHYSEGVSTVYALDDPNYPALQEEEQQRALENLAQESAAKEDEAAAATATPTSDVDMNKAASEEEEAQEETSPATVDASVEAAGDKVANSDATQPEVEDSAENAAPQESSPPSAQAETKAAVKPRPSRVFGLYFVGNKYNPGNYWSGRWRARYVADFEKQTLEGKASVAVHYYEQGNVQLSTELTSTSALPSTSPTPQEIVALVKSSESSFAAQLSDAYTSLSEDMFKSLRRTLPRSKAKLSWEKMVVYKAGQSLRAGESTQA